MFKEFFYTITIDKTNLREFKDLMLLNRTYYKTLSSTVKDVTINVLITNLREFYHLSNWLDNN
jgi:hypothetical protein